MAFLRGEPLVHKLALLARFIVLPAAMAAAIVYSPPDFSSPPKHVIKTSK